MRAAILPVGLSLLLALSAVPLAAYAQDDEFEDEFEDEEEPLEEEDLTVGDDEEEEDEEPVDGDEDLDALDGDVSPDADGEGAPDDDELRARSFRMHNTWYGPGGGIRVVDAGSGAVDSFRLQLATEFFSAGSYLNEGDQNDHIGASLSLSWTPAAFLEVFAAIGSYANSNDSERPQLFQVLGDTNIGAKLFHNVTPWLTVGGDLNLFLLNTVGDIGLVASSTSLGIRGNLTADLRRLDKPVPLIARLNLQYFIDNSGELIADAESQRYAALPDPRPLADEDRHLLSRVERYALNVNRTDRFNVAIGLEAPLQVSEDFFVHPMLEWQLGIPVNRQGYDCLFLPGSVGSDEPAAGADGCLDKQGISAFPQTLTLGVRVLPPVKGFAAFAAIDVGLTGVSTFVRELAPNEPYQVMLGLSYAYDTRPPPVPEPIVREVERRVEVQLPPPVKGRVHGAIVEQGAGSPVPNAVIRFPGRELTALFGGEDGTFTSYEFDPGEVQLEVSAPEYNPGTCAATIPAEGGVVEVRCELVALPRRGNVSGRVVSADGAAIAGASIQLTGGETRPLISDAAGNFAANDLPPGSYTLLVTADGFLVKQETTTVVVRQTAQITVTLTPRPTRSLVQVRRQEIVIRRQINFATDSAQILDDSTPLMLEIADVIIRNPQIRRIEIQGHTDNSGTATRNTALSQERADSVRAWLINAGVNAERLEARGYGPTRPLVPNITPGNRARNRRVQFLISEQTEAPATP